MSTKTVLPAITSQVQAIAAKASKGDKAAARDELLALKTKAQKVILQTKLYTGMVAGDLKKIKDLPSAKELAEILAAKDNAKEAGRKIASLAQKILDKNPTTNGLEERVLGIKLNPVLQALITEYQVAVDAAEQAIDSPVASSAEAEIHSSPATAAASAPAASAPQQPSHGLLQRMGAKAYSVVTNLAQGAKALGPRQLARDYGIPLTLAAVSQLTEHPEMLATYIGLDLLLRACRRRPQPRQQQPVAAAPQQQQQRPPVAPSRSTPASSNTQPSRRAAAPRRQPVSRTTPLADTRPSAPLQGSTLSAPSALPSLTAHADSAPAVVVSPDQQQQSVASTAASLPPQDQSAAVNVDSSGQQLNGSPSAPAVSSHPVSVPSGEDISAPTTVITSPAPAQEQHEEESAPAVVVAPGQQQSVPSASVDSSAQVEQSVEDSATAAVPAVERQDESATAAADSPTQPDSHSSAVVNSPAKEQAEDAVHSDQPVIVSSGSAPHQQEESAEAAVTSSNPASVPSAVAVSTAPAQEQVEDSSAKPASGQLSNPTLSRPKIDRSKQKQQNFKPSGLSFSVPGSKPKDDAPVLKADSSTVISHPLSSTAPLPLKKPPAGASTMGFAPDLAAAAAAKAKLRSAQPASVPSAKATALPVSATVSGLPYASLRPTGKPEAPDFKTSASSAKPSALPPRKPQRPPYDIVSGSVNQFEIENGKLACTFITGFMMKAMLENDQVNPENLDDALFEGIDSYSSAVEAFSKKWQDDLGDAYAQLDMGKPGFGWMEACGCAPKLAQKLKSVQEYSVKGIVVPNVFGTLSESNFESLFGSMRKIADETPGRLVVAAVTFGTGVGIAETFPVGIRSLGKGLYEYQFGNSHGTDAWGPGKVQLNKFLPSPFVPKAHENQFRQYVGTRVAAVSRGKATIDVAVSINQLKD